MRFQGAFRGLILCWAIVWFLPSAYPALKLEPVMSGLMRPVFVCAPPGDSNRLFVIEQQVSRIRVYDRQAKTLLATPFLTITGVRRSSEQGLLGMAFHPGYATNGHFYLNLTPSGGTNRTEIRRYTAQGDPSTSNVADASSSKLLLTFVQPYDNHNGGWMGFGPDGYLYIATGDGGSGDDPGNRAQSRTTLLGKILRIDVNVPEDAVPPYAIPSTNPYKDHATYRGEIWAFGLRNPWRCSFDRETGNLWIGDVGQTTREEIDMNPAGVGGLNFGWRVREGFIQNPAFPNETPVTDAVDPIFDYPRSLGASVTGGYVYRGNAVPELRGKYIFSDYVSERFWTTDIARLEELGTNATVQITTDINPNRTVITDVSSFGEDSEGELYICDLTGGEVFKIVAEGPVPAQVTAVQRVEDNFVLDFTALASVRYIVESTPLLEQGSTWAETATIGAETTNRTVSVTNEVTGAARYFRIRAE